MFYSRRNRHNTDAWPGFVDALGSILLVFVFMLLVFVVAQFALTEILVGRDRALDQLNTEISRLADTLSLEREKSDQQAERLEILESRLRATLEQKRQLESDLDQARKQRALFAAELEAAQQSLSTDREQLKLKLTELASLQADLNALRKLRRELEDRVADLALALETKDQALSETRTAATQNAAALADMEALRDQLRRELANLEADLAARRDALTQARDRALALETRLAEEQERTRLAQKEIEQRDLRIEQLLAQIDESDRALAEQKNLSRQGQAQVTRLNNQIAALREQIARLSASLSLKDTEIQSQQVKLEDLGRKLNLALAEKVKELSRYRSEFFGRLREALGDRDDILVVGDRFMFQSELLFESASAELGEGGKKQLGQLANTLKQVSRKIPKDLDWILRVDGHTDKRPISTPEFASNWELSTARALSVVKYLIQEGIPPQRLAATGFGEYAPLDQAETPEAFRKNRRIEIKLTNR